MQEMKSNQPYLLKAFFDWILDNGLTPYIVVNAQLPNVEVPRQFVNDGQIVLNVSPSACVNFHMDLENISFQARFGGQPMIVSLPCLAVGAIYAKENGAGTVFADAEELQQAYLQASQDKVGDTTQGDLKVTDEHSKQAKLSSVSTPTTKDDNDTIKHQTKKKPSLKVIK